MRTLIAILLTTLWSFGAPPLVGIAWDAPEPEELALIAAYRAHYGSESGVYDASVVIEHDGNYTARIEDLEPGKTYFLALTAVGKNGVESDFSNEISFTIAATPKAPTGLRTVTVTMETSQNMKDWQPLASVSRGVVDHEFFRLKIDDTRVAQ